MLPKVFIASSGDSRQVAFDAQELLTQDAQCHVWVNSFEPSKGTLETLTEWLNEADFGIFVFAADDEVLVKKKRVSLTRDNVLFEAGLFIGRLGMSRNFILRPKGADGFVLPTDLLGITTLGYSNDVEGGDYRQTLAAPCNKIRRAISQLGRRGIDESLLDQVAAVCYSGTGKSQEFCLIKTDSDRWIFPKDFCLRSETPWKTAEKSAFRLAGLRGEIEKQPIATFNHVRGGTHAELCVGAFPLFVKDRPKRQRGIQKNIWVKRSEVERYLSVGREMHHLEELMNVVDSIPNEASSASDP